MPPDVLGAWTAGLVGPRDPAQPLLTLLDGPARVELSGATTANWVAKSANLLVDGLGGPQRVGLLLPLHWQTVVLLLAAVATGAEAVLADAPAQLTGCDAVFASADDAEAALQTGADDVLAVSLHPLGAPLQRVPPLVLDHSREVPGHADHWGGPAPAGVRVTAGGAPLGPLPELGLGTADRVLLTGSPAQAATGRLLLAVLSAGAALLLVPDPQTVDVEVAAAAEHATASAGLTVPGLRRLDG